MEQTSNFGQWLRQRRKALGLTQKTLAQQAGCAEVTLRKIESGDLQPSAPLVTSLAKALGADDADLPDLIALARGTVGNFTTTARLLRPQRPNNLPAQLTPLIGRAHDITVVRRRLLSDGARLVTLVGPPGVGKTRLSLAVAADVLEQFDDGAFFVRLGPISDPDQVAAAVAQTLGLQMAGPNPPELQLRAWLEEKHLLLVLDNFEQIVAAAPLVDDLLRRCPWLHVLVTSRQPLRVRGERQIHVQPLALPAEMAGASAVTAADMLRYPSIELFAERAEAVLPDFAVDDGNAAAVAELCRRLDGLPLAIELVAARIKLLPPNELLARLHGPWLLSTDGLRDVSARQKTLRGAIGWSYDLLTPVEQTLFTRLAVFVGGCTLQAVEMMCEDALSPAQVFDGIGSLIDKNLLHRETGMHGDARYVMLETVREYGLDRLTQTSQEVNLRQRHVMCFSRLIEKADQADASPERLHLRLFMDDDINNVRTALAWAQGHDVQAALLLTAPLLHWFGQQGPYAEGQRLIEKIFALPNASAHTILRAKALCEAGILMLCIDETDKAQVYEEESLNLSQELGFVKGQADALLNLGRIKHEVRRDQEAAYHYYKRALTTYGALGNPGGVSYATLLLGDLALSMGDFPQARSLIEESLNIAKQADISYQWPQMILSDIASAEGDLEEARSLLEEVLAIQRLNEGKGTIADTLIDLGHIATRQGDFTAAHDFLDETLLLRNELGNKNMVCVSYLVLAELSQAEGNYMRAVQLYRASLGGVGHYVWLWAKFLLDLAALSEEFGQHELSARLLGSIEAVDKAIHRLWPPYRKDYHHLIDTVRAHLDATSYDVAWTNGRELAFEQAAEEAVSILEKVLRDKEQVTPEAGHA